MFVAAHNEAAALPATLAALLAQDDPPEEILIADDGSTDATAIVLVAEFGLTAPGWSGQHPVMVGTTSIIWLWLRNGGKAHALNAAIVETTADIALTVDADTLFRTEGPLVLCAKPFRAIPNWSASPGSSPRFVGRRPSVRVFSSSRSTSTFAISSADTRGCVSAAWS